MASEINEALRLEIAHVLFTDIVGYSKLPMDEKTTTLQRLNLRVRATSEFQRAEANDQLIRLPTGDGMALVFFGDAESALRCALEVSRALRAQPGLQWRMGVHPGPVYRVADINTNKNVAGGGINMAQRVMDCGDAGHILVSEAVAEVLGQLSTWAKQLHDLGEAEVKHGVRVHVFNVYTEEHGNAALPETRTDAATDTDAAADTTAAVCARRHTDRAARAAWRISQQRGRGRRAGLARGAALQTQCAAG